MSSDGGSQCSFEETPGSYRFTFDHMYDDNGAPPISPLVKFQARHMDPNEGRCLITNTSLESGVTFIHCLPRRVRDNRKWKGRMEWYWGLRWNELDFDSPRNVFAGGIFDFPTMKPSWILLPEDLIVDKFYNSLTRLDENEKSCEGQGKIKTVYASRGSLPALEGTTFKYRLIPLPQRMQSMVLTRHANPNPDPSVSPNPPDFSVHLHPFDALPWVTSHLDPKFVIMDAGRKLLLTPSYFVYGQGWFTSRPSLYKVLAISEAWRAPIPSVAFSGRCPDYYTPDMHCTPDTIRNITHIHEQTPYFSDTVVRKREKEAKKWASQQNYDFNSKQLSPYKQQGKWTSDAEVTRWLQDVGVQTNLPDIHGVVSTAVGSDEEGQPTQDVDADTQTDGVCIPRRSLGDC